MPAASKTGTYVHDWYKRGGGVFRGLVDAPGRIRTCDTWLRRPLLYPLSYGRGPLIVLPREARGPGTYREQLKAAGGGAEITRAMH